MVSKIKNQKSKIKNFAFCILIFTFSFAEEGYSDILRLKEIPEGKDGHEVEILEEREDSFIIKVPKEEIKVIKRKRPIDISLWKEKRILWEDAGDYITIYLPKEKIILPEGYTGKEYDSAKVFKESLNSAGDESRPEDAGIWKATGRVVGRIVKRGEPILGVRLKIVNVSYQQDAFTRIFSPKEMKPEDLVFETTTDGNGSYVFKSIPIGEYDIYWAFPGTESWSRRLSERPDITVRPGETVKYPDIEIK